MNTYKLGNKVTGIIRAYSSGKIGDTIIQYDNQPYTILKSISANLIFTDIDKNIKSGFVDLSYNNSKLYQIKLSDVSLNDKILNLIFLKSKTKLVSKVENYISDNNNKIYVNTTTDQIYQVFVYNNSGALEVAYGTYDTNKPISVSEPNKDYLICYQYEVDKGFSLDAPENLYFTLDLIITGNIEDNTSNMNIHIEKCGLKIDKNMYFNQNANAIDLTFTVIDTGENYITIE